MKPREKPETQRFQAGRCPAVDALLPAAASFESQPQLWQNRAFGSRSVPHSGQTKSVPPTLTTIQSLGTAR